MPKAVDQTILRIRFDSSGNVSDVDKMGLEHVAKISPEGDTTPTLGRDRGLFQAIFGNIGAVGAGGAGSGPPGPGPNGSRGCMAQAHPITFSMNSAPPASSRRFSSFAK